MLSFAPVDLTLGKNLDQITNLAKLNEKEHFIKGQEQREERV